MSARCEHGYKNSDWCRECLTFRAIPEGAPEPECVCADFLTCEHAFAALESENARLKRELQEARKEYQTSIKMYIVENRRLNSELAAYREVVEAAKKIDAERILEGMGIQTGDWPGPFPSPYRSYGIQEAPLWELRVALSRLTPTGTEK